MQMLQQPSISQAILCSPLLLIYLGRSLAFKKNGLSKIKIRENFVVLICWLSVAYLKLMSCPSAELDPATQVVEEAGEGGVEKHRRSTH